MGFFLFSQVPFIAFYRKEHIEPDLKINDLWKIWQWDEKVLLLYDFTFYFFFSSG